MRIISLSLLLYSLLFAGCCKHMDHIDNPPVTSCNCPSLVKSVDSNSIIGCWVLTDSNFYSALPGHLDTTWIPVPGDSAIIRFNPDSSFCFNANFPWSYAQYDKFTQVGNYMWLVSSPGGLNVNSAGITLAGNNELILTRHGVDTGIRERYKRR